MILRPATLSLILIALLTAGLGLYAGYYAVKIHENWDTSCGSEQQLALERRTYLISTIMSFVITLELISLFLFIYTADNLHNQFAGAMCAAGSLAVNPYGYPALLLKVINFLLGGVWLILNRADNKGYDYPLIRTKAAFLTVMVPLLVQESITVILYFIGIKTDVITSCCGSLFSSAANSFTGDLAALPHRPMQILFFLSMAITLLSGIFFYTRKRSGYLFSISSAVTFLISIISIISFISLYIYELPSHHCPFCLLQKEYDYIGYTLYICLFGGAVAGIATGVLMPYRQIGSLKRIIPETQRRLALAAVIFYLIFSLVTAWKILASTLKLG